LRRCAAGAALVSLLLLSSPAGAGSLALAYSGILTTVSDPEGLLPVALAPGASVSGTFAVASGASCLPVSPTTCEYLTSPASLSLSLAEGPFAQVDGSAYLFVEDGPLADSFSASVGVPAEETAGGAGPVWMSGDLQLLDPKATALGGMGLPTAFDPTGFAQRTFDAGGCYGGTCTGGAQDQFQVTGTIFTLQVVPEPGAGTLLTLGLLALRCGSAGRRRGPRPGAP
jgi:hypothetical protein